MLENTRLLHLEVEVVPLTRPLADACEDGVALVLARHVADQLLNQDGLAKPRAPEQADLAALDERRDQVDHLQTGLEDLGRRLKVLEAGRVAVDRPAFVGLDRRVRVDRLTEHVEDSSQRGLPDRHGDRCTSVDHVDAARDPVRRIHGDGADAVVAEMLLNLAINTPSGPSSTGTGDLQCRVDPGTVRERDVDHDALISTTLPTFCCSGMRLLEDRNRATSEAPHQQLEFTEGPIRLVRNGCCVVGLQHRRHTFGVIQASDVRADK